MMLIRILILIELTCLTFCFGQAFGANEVADGLKAQSQIEVHSPGIVPLSSGKMQFKLATVCTRQAAPGDMAVDSIPAVMNVRVGPGWSSPGWLATWYYDRAKRQFDTYATDGRKLEELKIIQFDQQRVVLQGRLLVGPTGGTQTQYYDGIRQGNRIVGKSKGVWLIFSGVGDWEAWW